MDGYLPWSIFSRLLGASTENKTAHKNCFLAQTGVENALFYLVGSF